MNEAAIRQKLSELSEAMADLPKAGGTTPAVGTAEGMYCSQVSTQAGSVEDSLDHLRMQVKYLMFDLEATRRENRYLRQMLENRNRRREDGANGLEDF